MDNGQGTTHTSKPATAGRQPPGAGRFLIVNADDFGLTERVNLAIIDGHCRGIITSATLMANGNAFESAVDLARCHQRLGLGVHLNLIEGAPVAGAERVPTLVDRAGRLAFTAESLAVALLRRRVNLADVERELRAQVEKVLGAGLAVTHLDGHKHAHMLPRVFGIVVRIASDYGIGGVRCATEARPSVLSTLGAFRSSAMRIGKQFLTGRALSVRGAALRRRLERAHLHSPRYLLGVTQTGFLDARGVERLLQNLPLGSTELMCHPGYVDSELLGMRTRLRESRERELEALTSAEVKDLIRREHVQLITYRDLAETP